MADVTQFLQSLFDLNGTASRKRGWLVFVALVAAVLAAQGLVAQMPALNWAAVLTLGLSLITAPVLLLLPSRNIARQGHPNARRIGAIGLCLVAALFVSKAFYWQPYLVPSENMKPTLLVGDYVIATPVSAADLQRGDVVVFRHPVKSWDMIARLIGLPGDTVQMRQGQVYVNGTLAPQVADGMFEEVYEPQGQMQILPRCMNQVANAGEICQKLRFVETFPNGRSHAILNIEDGGYFDDSEVFTLPEGMVFMPGDNRDNSMDSRFGRKAGGPGFVPIECVTKRVRIVAFSSAGAMISNVFTWRTGRYWKAVE